MRYICFFSSRRRHTRLQGDWSSDVCSSDLVRRLGLDGPFRLCDPLCRACFPRPLCRIELQRAMRELVAFPPRLVGTQPAPHGLDLVVRSAVWIQQLTLPTVSTRYCARNASSVESTFQRVSAPLGDVG